MAKILLLKTKIFVRFFVKYSLNRNLKIASNVSSEENLLITFKNSDVLLPAKTLTLKFKVISDFENAGLNQN